VPRVSANAGAGILQRFELKATWRQTNRASVSQQQLAIGGDQVRHSVAFPHVPVQPESPIHRERHSIATAAEFSVARRFCH